MTDHSRETLIKDLSANLTPVRRPGDTLRALALWLALAIFYGVAVVLATGDLRDGAAAALLASPEVALETVVGAAAIALLAHATLRSGIPGARAAASAVPAGIALGVWLALYVAAIAIGTDSVSMLGKRDHCFWQTVLFAVPSFALLLVYARRLLPLLPSSTAALAGASAAAISGALMQFACMYDPLHTLTYHLSPIALFALGGALIGRRVLVPAAVAGRPRRAATH